MAIGAGGAERRNPDDAGAGLKPFPLDRNMDDLASRSNARIELLEMKIGRNVTLAHFVTYSHDAKHRVTEIRENDTMLLAGYGCDGLGRRLSTARGNGTSTGYTWDADDDARRIVHDFAGGSVSFDDGYDASGRRTGLAVSDAAYLPQPVRDDANYTVWEEGQQFHPIYTRITNDTQTYDKAGNLVDNPHSGNAYVFDGENRLIEVSNDVSEASYAYDVFGRRVETTVDGVVTRFL